MKLIAPITLLIWLFPAQAQAYVDPGILGVLYQWIYFLIFGVLAGWVLKPFNYLSSLFRKFKTRFSGEKPHDPPN